MKAQAQTVVVGLGTTGLACARFLAARGDAFTVVDSRDRPPQLETLRAECPGAEIVTGVLPEALLAGAGEILLSPGVPVAEPAIQVAIRQGVPVISEIELFCRHARAPIAAITGSNGKSTVTTLVGRMAAAAGRRAAVGGNLGRPALALLEDGDVDLYVLELSSFQLETTRSLRAQAAAVLNVSADHMDRYPSLADYAQAKGVIYHGAETAVVNRADPVAAGLVDGTVGRVVSFGLDTPERAGDFGLLDDDTGRTWLVQGARRLLETAGLKVVGRHNQANVLAALALGEAMGLAEDAMLAAAADFPGLPHRTEWVLRHNGVDYINDSKGTNVGAALAAIEGLSGPLVLIAGGQGKGADFAPLGDAVADKVRAVVLIGADAPVIAAALGERVPVYRERDMVAAVARAAGLAVPGDQVLLSPACASFDMFPGFEARGEAFKRAVREVTHG